MSGRIWTLSSLLSILRIVLLVPFAHFLLSDAPDARAWAAVISLLAVATDFLDGFIARALHQVTEFGKIVDPIADKIVIGVASVLLVQTGDLEWWVAALVVLRDVLILVGGISIHRKKHITVQSNWPGKVAVGALAVLILFGVLRPVGWEWFRTSTLIFSLFMSALSLALYAQRLFIGRAADVADHANGSR
jgi:CDP-diacylglycerol--glycerol-3-phosphate 3-phosphatidyltransferase